MVAHLSQCYYGDTVDNLHTHLLWCPYGNAHTIAHDTFQNTITTIVLESGAHVSQCLPPLPLPHLMTSGYPYHQK
jgi:hypothetical protein